MAYQVLLSDADQTLFDFHQSERHAISETLTQFSIDPTPEMISLYHQINDSLWKRIEKGEITSEKLKVERFSQFLQVTGHAGDPTLMSGVYIEQLSQQRFLISGALEFCAEVSRHMPIILVTNGVPQVQRSRFLQCDLTPYLSGLVVSEEVGKPKPHPDMLYRALEMANVTDPSRAIMLGDSLTSDIAAANNASIPSILFTNGSDAPANHGATYTAKKLSDAQSIILDNASCLL